ncbi:universal stress protein [Streptomyces viridochromogenes]|uniref:Putative stress-inducible protein n=1 Tax=Streptomyces viridochromogenes Tue57 TaxID=1160705 RepID=L8PAV7_STRVR|nr:universal stress protein [Streptomyces viridochromogenes]ELS54706.1 putative stress-inducible protein [Streptomyces viridochromogenes Tue57]
MTLQHVVVGVDGSLVSVRALDQAADEAARRGAALRVVYAVPDRDEAGPVLASAASRVRERHPAVPVETRAEEDGAVRALVRESADAVLTVVGTRGLGAFAGLVAGAVSLRLLAQVNGPLLVVRGDRPHGDRRDVLLGLESDSDAEAAVYAMEEAERRGARLRVLHSWTHRHTAPELPSLIPATSPGQQRLALRGQAEEAVPRFAMAEIRDQHPGVEVESRTVRTAAAHALVEATRQAAVVVIGSHRGARPGLVAHVLLHHSHCPVVVVPGG